ncbi:MAG: nucleoside triphosphate pyrophosphohydrolase [Chloroherpetonaceae bacterium]|nr:nucleoside triphosphate pyrophosphohydrolase [Chloroherpetonaceae bacterium]MCS7210945.1 nucleoside triphosphate pyrophosphohydrolase [Chloroherpetonaceae bacterium]MDW8019544.1 nucleoside triphosphate pyrophosphohydrolase [Chloroherpetonaceae bacterium]MDW8465579.1 nucleoside triphosphate pyrophosphohydrolase [Chloroherpetonaceae bacterium]
MPTKRSVNTPVAASSKKVQAKHRRAHAAKQTSSTCDSRRDEHKKHLQTAKPETLGAKFERLYDIVELLRAECPWDRAQTPDSLVHLTLEEVYEMIHAVDTKDEKELKKELGDLLLHICFQAVLAKEREAFSMPDVLDAIAEKLIFRHPHVFGSESAKTASEVMQNWEKLKMKEGRKSALEGVPKAMPELLRAYRVQEKAAGVGFDWTHADDVLKKIQEEIGELKAATSAEEQEAELGDILFSLVNYCRFIKVNPEDALRKTTEKFIRRFRFVEEQVLKSGKAWSEFTLAELDEFWNTAKQKEKLTQSSMPENAINQKNAFYQ